jgi:hypothetical protein
MSATTSTRPLPPEVRAKLAKLVPLFASDLEGERVGALAAIERVLKASGLDWHDFTGAFAAASSSSSTSSSSSSTSSSSRSPPRNEAPKSTNGDQNVPASALRTTIEMIRAKRKFNAKSEAFLDSMLWRAKSHSTVYVSKKQWKWLCGLAAQAGIGV